MKSGALVPTASGIYGFSNLSSTGGEFSIGSTAEWSKRRSRFVNLLNRYIVIPIDLRISNFGLRFTASHGTPLVVGRNHPVRSRFDWHGAARVSGDNYHSCWRAPSPGDARAGEKHRVGNDRRLGAVDYGV